MAGRGLEGRQRACVLGWVVGLFWVFFFSRQMVRYGKKKKKGFSLAIQPSRNKKKNYPRQRSKKDGDETRCAAALCPTKLLIYRKKTNEEGGGRNSMALVAIALPALGARCPVATVFVLWEKGDNDRVRPRMEGCSAPSARPLPSSCGSECTGGLTPLWAALSPLSPKKVASGTCRCFKNNNKK